MPRDPFVLENLDLDSAVLCLSLGGLIAVHLLTHSARGEHIRQGDVTLLLQERCDIAGTFAAQPLIQRRRSDCRWSPLFPQP